MALSPTTIDRFGRPLQGAADPLYYQRERERARQAGRELRAQDVAAAHVAIEKAAHTLQKKSRRAPVLKRLKPRALTKRDRVLAILGARPATASTLSRAVYGAISGVKEQRIYRVLRDLKRDGLVVSIGRRWYIKKESRNGHLVCPHCGGHGYIG